IAREENSTDHNFQQPIPRDYKEWRYFYKNEYLNERRPGDCRPPRAKVPAVLLPVAIESSLEVLETIDYEPPRMLVAEDWTRQSYDLKRESECKKLFRRTDPNDYAQDQRFVNDVTGNKLVPYSRNGQFQSGVKVFCDDHIWFATHLEEREKMIITR